MHKAVNFGVVLLLGFITTHGCQNHSLEKDFFRQPLGNRLERMRQYSLEDQYKIFRYGHDVIHPPLLDLAQPIAEKGAAAVPLLLKKLDEVHGFEALHILYIFDEMARIRSYDVKSDKAVMAKLTSKVSEVKDDGWRRTFESILQDIKNAK